MIKEKQIFLECFSGNKVDEMLPLIDLLCVNGYDVFYSFNGYKDQYKSLVSHDNATQLKEKNKKYYEIIKTSKWIFLNTNLMTGTKFIKQKGQIVVQLWHGVPFKYIGNDVKYSIGNPNDLFTKTMNHELQQTDYFLIPNDFCKTVFSNGFAIPDSVKLLLTGYPRNDYLFTDYNSVNHKDLNISEDKKIVLYTPTWNDKGMYGVYEFTQNINAIVEELSETHFFIFSFHPGTKKVINFNPKTSNWIINKGSKISNIDLFNLSDVLVTDFSSIMFDFALTGKPVINFFKKEEYDDYIAHRGAYFDMKEEKFNCAQNPQELINFLKRTNSLNNRIEKYSPAKELSTIKILETVGIKIENKHFTKYPKVKIELDNNFEDFIVKNPNIFKLLFRIKRSILKLK